VLAHWDDAPARRFDVGPLRLVRIDIGEAIGSDRVGAALLRLEPGGRSSPVHVELAEEEIFFVLRGSGLLWQDEVTHEVGEGDCIVHVAQREAHALIAGAEGLDVLAFGERALPGAAYLPRAGVARLGVTVEVSQEPHPWEREAAAGELELPAPSPRPRNVVALADAVEGFGGAARFLGESAGAVRTGLNHVSLAPGASGAPHHCHSAEEEMFVALGGSATLRLGEERHELRPGHALSRPAGTGVAHSFVAGAGGFVYLAYGTRDPNDIAYYPEQGEVRLRGVGVTLRTGG
jgi:uncharacterized cupin superfamily protein